MNYKAIITLKKADTEGRIPAYTLDQYVRSELGQKLMNALQPHLLIDRSEATHETDPATVAFTTELILVKPDQWCQLKELLLTTTDRLPAEQQLAIRQLISDVDLSG